MAQQPPRPRQPQFQRPRDGSRPAVRAEETRRVVNQLQSTSRWLGLLRIGLLTLVVLGALVGGAMLLLSFAFPGDTVRDYLVAEVKARTGRDLAIEGPVTFSSGTAATVTLQDVTLSSPADMGGPPLANIREMTVRVAMWPLLWRNVVVESVVLKDPVVDLLVDGNGQRNWNIKRQSAHHDTPADRVQLAQASGPTATDATDTVPKAPFESLRRHAITDVSLDNLTIENGTIRYADARHGKGVEATRVTAKVAMPSLASPATMTGSLDFRGEAIDFNLELGAVEPLLANASSRAAVKLTSRPFVATYEGSIFPANGEADGSITLNAASLARTAAWLGASVPPDTEFGALDLTGQLRSSGKIHTLSNAVLTVNATKAVGTVTVDASHPRPLIRGDLNVPDLDLNTLLSPPVAPTNADPASPVDGAQQPPPNGGGPQVKGYAARGGWSEDPIRLNALMTANADIKLAIGALRYKEMRAGASRILVALSDGLLKASLEDAAMYDGHGRGFVVLDGRVPQIANVAINLAFEGISLQPFLTDAAQLDWVEGKGNASLAVSGAGAHQRGLIESLNGQADLKVAKGAVHGIDINRIADNLADGRFNDLKPSPDDKTAFSSLTATWQIQQGVAHNSDLRLASDAVQVTGAGRVILPDRTLDYTVRPKLAAATREDAEPGSGGGVEVPVHVSGSWEKPKYKADLGGAVEGLSQRLKGKNADEIVDELVGKDSKTGKKAKKLLDKLFR